MFLKPECHNLAAIDFCLCLIAEIFNDDMGPSLGNHSTRSNQDGISLPTEIEFIMSHKSSCLEVMLFKPQTNLKILASSGTHRLCPDNCRELPLVPVCRAPEDYRIPETFLGQALRPLP